MTDNERLHWYRDTMNYWRRATVRVTLLFLVASVFCLGTAYLADKWRVEATKCRSSVSK